MLEEGERGAKGHPGSEAGRPVGEEGAWPRFHGNRLGHKDEHGKKTTGAAAWSLDWKGVG